MGFYVGKKQDSTTKGKIRKQRDEQKIQIKLSLEFDNFKSLKYN